MRKVLERCPTCGGELTVTRMTCPSCNTTIEAEYDPCPFCRLTPDSSSFLKVFVRSRGNIKEIERELGISYNSARARLDDLLSELGYDPDIPKSLGLHPSRETVLKALAAGEITSGQAMRLLGEDGRK